MFSQRGEIVRIMIHVMAAGGLSGSAVTAPIMGDDAKAFADKEKHLCVPIVRRERPAMTENDRLSFAPVLIIDVDVSSVFFSDSYVWHCNFSFSLMGHWCLPRFTSDKNQVRRSVSSIQTSIKLAVAKSRCSSQTLCASRRHAAIILLSSANS